jgi:hypothetical protein
MQKTAALKITAAACRAGNNHLKKLEKNKVG